MSPRRSVPAGARLVVKVGSSSLTRDAGLLDPAALALVVDQVAEAWQRGNPTVLVSSGAVAAGLPALGLTARPGDLPSLQVAAAVGQSRLMEHYTSRFSARGLVTGQVLLTKDILANREQYLNARQALDRMLGQGVVPVVNENDTVVVEELRLGDNDRLAALVSHLVGAGMLVILTDTPGLYSGDPRLEDDAELLSAVRHTDEVLDEVAKGASGPLGSGGVATKVAAARMAAWSGIPTVVARAGETEVLKRAVAGEDVGTWVEPHPTRLSSRKLWIAFGQPSEGRIVVDAGAMRALIGAGRSLLAVGVTGVDGDFPAGAAVEVLGPDGELVAKGLCRVDAAAARRRQGRRAPDGEDSELIHRDDLVVLVAAP